MSFESINFEDETRRIARQLWPDANYSGATIIDGRERDGVFETEECIYFLEATCDRSKVKAEKDAEKISKLILQNIRFEKPSIGYIVTKHEPTADQRDVVRKIISKNKIKINILSFSQFQSKIIDVNEYLSLRENHSFGSIHDPKTGKYNNDIKYIDGTASDKLSNIWKSQDICNAILEGKNFILTGDYGTGKSMTLRDVYKNLSYAYKDKKTCRFPIYINLREHQKQIDIDEILERHAKKIGFEKKSNLVRAWKAGYCHLILDGFDEMMSIGISNHKDIKKIRYTAVSSIRKFIESAPKDTGIIIAGRKHYFDSTSEMKNSLGLTDFTYLNIGDFTLEQVDIFLKTYGIRTQLPKWIPTRPLLLGTLLLKGYLEKGKDITDPAEGWDILLDEISKREAKIESSISQDAIREFLETLATMARRTDDGLGAITHENIVQAYSISCGSDPDDDAMVLLLRLPGIGFYPNDITLRKFVDEDFCSACSGGFLFRCVSEYNENYIDIIENVQSELSDIGLSIFEYKSKDITHKNATAIINNMYKRVKNPYIHHDLLKISQSKNININQALLITGIVGSLYINTEYDLSNVCYSDCIFESIEIDGHVEKNKILHINKSYISSVDGIFESEKHIIFDDQCEIEHFEQQLATTDSIMDAQIDIRVKVLMSILKKLYIQKGAGRLESAFLRGLDINAKKYVHDILKILQSDGIAIKFSRSGSEIWLPDKKLFPRIGRIISTPTLCNDNIISKVLSL